MAHSSTGEIGPPVEEGEVTIYALPGSGSARDPAAKGAFDNLLSLLQGDEILISWGKYGLLEHLVRKGGLPVGACPSSSMEPEDQRFCLIDLCAELIGLASGSNSLRFGHLNSLRGVEMVQLNHFYEDVPVLGGTVNFLLTPDGQILSVSSTLIPDLKVLLPEGVSNAQSVLNSFNASSAKANVENELGLEVTLSEMGNRIFVDRKAAKPVGVPVKVGVAVENASKREWYIRFDPVTGEVLYRRDITPASDDIYLNTYAYFPRDSSVTDCPSLNDCEELPYFTKDCSEHYEDSSQQTLSRCVQHCTWDGNYACYGSGALTENWIGCECVLGGEGEGYCGVISDDIDLYTPLNVFMDTNGVEEGGDWPNATIPYHKAFARIQEALWDVREFHQDQMGMNGWVDPDPSSGEYRHYTVQIMYNYEAESLMMGDCSAPAAASWSNKRVILCEWMKYLVDNPDTNELQSDIHSLLSHEFAHLLVRQSHPGTPGYPYPPVHFVDGLDECIPDIFGSILSGQEVSSSSPWTPDCTGRSGSTTAHRNKWRNYSCGLSNCCSREMPYSHRSYFDFLPCDGTGPTTIGGTCTTSADCEPYQSCEGSTCKIDKWIANNKDVWQRFTRLLYGGSDALETGYSEDIGSSFAGLDPGCASEIIWTALNSLQDGQGVKHWINLLITSSASLEGQAGSSCYSLDAKNTMAHALEASGFPALRQQVPWFSSATVTNGRVAAVYWPDWDSSSTPANLRYFWASAEGGDLVVRYLRNGYLRTNTLYSNETYPPLGRPAIVRYRSEVVDAVYVFWVASISGLGNKLLFRYKTLDDPLLWYPGLNDPPYELDTDGIIPSGSVAAASVVDTVDDPTNMLTVLFTDTDDDTVGTLTCINPSDVCWPATRWKSMSTGGTSRYASNGLSAVWARQVHGVDESETVVDASLYVAYQNAVSPAKLTVSRASINPFDGSVTWEYDARLPNSEPYPTDSTNAPLGIAVRRSAFSNHPSAFPTSNYNYLYLFWHSQNASQHEKYVSVLQNFGEAPNETQWFTLPAPWMTDDAPQESGANAVSFVKGIPPSWDILGLVTVDDDGKPWLELNRHPY